MRIRAAMVEDAAGIARVHIDSWRTTYAGIVPDAYLAGLSYEAREARWEERLGDLPVDDCVYIAVDEAGQIAGFAGGGPQRTALPGYAGELYAIYLLRVAQGQGLGRQLTSRVAAHLLRQGMRSMAVWVLTANPSRGFYEALGGQLIGEQPIAIGGATLQEAAYGWSEVAPLLVPATLA